MTKIRDELKQILEVILVWSSSLHTISLHGKWFQNTSPSKYYIKISIFTLRLNIV